MIDLYTAVTPNGFKVSMVLEELGLPYTVKRVDLRAGEQFTPEYVRVNPNSKIPAIVDHDAGGGRALTVFESGAILLYLAEKTGRLLPSHGPERHVVLQWLFFQVGGIGPMFGQAYHFRTDASVKDEYAIDRYTKEARRLYDVVDRQLAVSTYLAGPEITIADFANLPWLQWPASFGVDPRDIPNVMRWVQLLRDRPSVQRGLNVPPRMTTTSQPSRGIGSAAT